MCKPRFPLSVTRQFYFRSRIESTGEMIDCNDFKTLYRVTRSHLRTEVLYKEKEYKRSSAVLEFGYETCYEIEPCYFYTEWTQLDDFGCMFVSTLSESFYRTSDEAEHLISGKFEY